MAATAAACTRVSRPPDWLWFLRLFSPSHNPRFGAGARPRGGGSRTLAAASSGTQHPPGRSAATLPGYLAELHEQRFRAGVALGHDRRGAALVGHLAELQERGRAPSSASTASATSAAVLREGEIRRLETVPVAVDVQVRRVTENLGVTNTYGPELNRIKKQIQQAWSDGVAAARIGGPERIAGTCCALDPALWFYGKHGCSHCATVKRQVRFGRACDDCRFPLPAPSG